MDTFKNLEVENTGDVRADGKDGAIELCFRLLLSGRKLDEVLSELSAAPAAPADRAIEAGVGDRAAGEPFAWNATRSAIGHEDAAWRHSEAPGCLLRVPAQLNFPDGSSDAAAGDAETREAPPDAALPVECAETAGRGHEWRSRAASVAAILHSAIVSGRGAASRPIAGVVLCGLLVGGGASAVWHIGDPTGPHRPFANRTLAAVEFTGSASAATPRASEARIADVRPAAAPAILASLPAARAAPSRAAGVAASGAFAAPQIAPHPRQGDAAAAEAAEPGRSAPSIRLATLRPPSATVSRGVAVIATPKAATAEPPLSASDVDGLLARGDALLATGDVTTARLFYRRGAEGGNGAAALRLGETFDPAFLGQAGLPQIAGDASRAAYWYRKAHDLGAADAASLLKQIEPGTPQ